MKIPKIVNLVFGLLMVLANAQEKHYDFTAFGKTPKVVDNNLYVGLNNAETQEVYFKYLDTIARIHLKSGHSDSLMYYAGLLKNKTLYKIDDTTPIDKYRLKAFYYQGIGAHKMGLLDEAINSFIKGIEASDSSTLIQNYLKLQLAETYLSKGQIEKSQNILEALPQASKIKDFYFKNIIVKSKFLIIEKHYDLAKAMINKALSEDLLDHYKKLRLELLLNLSQIELREKKYNELIMSSDKIKNEALDEGFYDLYIEASLNVGYAYAMLKDYDISEVALNSAYINTLQWNRLELQKKVIGALANLYKAKGNYKNAYNLITQYQAVSKKIRENQNQRLIKDLEFKYETLKKEKEINKLQDDKLLKEAEIDRQKTIKYAFLIGFLIILIPIILLLTVYYQKLQAQSLLNEQQEAINQQEVKALLQAQELDLTKNTIAVQAKERDRIARELHDSIGGNLAGIKLKMNSLDTHHPDFKQILSQLDATYDQVREISHSLIPKEFETSTFTDLIKKYIQNISEDTSVSLRFEAYPNDAINTIDIKLQVTLFSIIKELVTNAFKHANAEEIILHLTSLSEEKSIELIYEDDGVGFNRDKVSNGIGLNNIKTRVADFNGEISINTAKNRGTVISISIPQE